MNNLNKEIDEKERTVVKFTTTESVGVVPTRLSRNAIGYIIRGEKYIHEDDRFQRVGQGEIFFLGQGTHYIENMPEIGDTFEQIIFYYTPSKLQQIIASLNTESINLDINQHTGNLNTNNSVAIATPSKLTRNFFTSANRHYEYGGFLHNKESEKIHLMELAYLILTQEDNKIRENMLLSLDQNKAEFERVIYSNLLSDKSVEELAEECSRSLTSFKKEFKRIFGTPPHQWYLRQRLNYAKLLLNTTRESISQVGNLCAFPNTSHFIKLFKRYFGYTPAVYRAEHRNENHESELSEMQEMSKEAKKVEMA
ncbi:MAG: AraC family transcriptional regulator [Rikenellaceae bacterium]